MPSRRVPSEQAKRPPKKPQPTDPAVLEQLDGKWLDGLLFCAHAYALFERLVAQPLGIQKIRVRQRVEKRLMEEVVPICRYVQTYYGLGRYLNVCWTDGNQKGDAKVRTTGGLVDAHAWPAAATLEITQAQHPNEHLLQKRLNTQGFAFGLDGLSVAKGADGERIVESRPTGFSEGSHIESFATIVLKSIRDKIGKGYPPETTLIVNCALNTAYHGFEWEQLMRQVQLRLPDHPFREIFVCSSNGWFCTSLASGPNPAS